MRTSGPSAKTGRSVDVSTVAFRHAVLRYSAYFSLNCAFRTHEWVDGIVLRGQGLRVAVRGGALG